MVDELRSRPGAKTLSVQRQHAREQLAHPRVGRLPIDDRLQIGPHLVDRPRRASDAVLFTEAVEPVAIADPPNLLEHELEALVEDVPLSQHLDEVALLELRAQ